MRAAKIHKGRKRARPNDVGFVFQETTKGLASHKGKRTTGAHIAFIPGRGKTTTAGPFRLLSSSDCRKTEQRDTAGGKVVGDLPSKGDGGRKGPAGSRKN